MNESNLKSYFTDPYENTKEILLEISKPVGLTEAKHLNYLNAFVKLILHVNKDVSKLGYCTEEILSWFVVEFVCFVNEIVNCVL